MPTPKRVDWIMSYTEFGGKNRELNLGTSQLGLPVTGYPQGADLSGHGLFFTTAIQTATSLGATQIDLYLVRGGANPLLVLAGTLGDHVVTSAPAAWPSDDMATQFIDAIHEVQNQERLRARSSGA